MSPSYHPRSSLLSTDADMGVNARHARTHASTHAREHARSSSRVCEFQGSACVAVLYNLTCCRTRYYSDRSYRASRTDLSSFFSFSFSQSVSQESPSPFRVSPFRMSLFSWSFWSANSWFTYERIKYYVIFRYIALTSTLINIEFVFQYSNKLINEKIILYKEKNVFSKNNCMEKNAKISKNLDIHLDICRSENNFATII